MKKCYISFLCIIIAVCLLGLLFNREKNPQAIVDKSSAFLTEQSYQIVSGTNLVAGTSGFSFITADSYVCQILFPGECNILDDMGKVEMIDSSYDGRYLDAITQNGTFISSNYIDCSFGQKDNATLKLISYAKQFEGLENIVFFQSEYPQKGLFVHANGTVTLITSSLDNTDRLLTETTWGNITQIAQTGDDIIGLTNEGTIQYLDDSPYCEDYETWQNIATIYGGGTHIFALTTNGKVQSAGKDFWGEGHTGEWSDVVSLAPARTHTVGLKSDGTVMAIGSNLYGQCNVESWQHIIAIAACETYTLGIDINGRLWIAGKTSQPVDIDYCSSLIANLFIGMNGVPHIES